MYTTIKKFTTVSICIFLFSCNDTNSNISEVCNHNEIKNNIISHLEDIHDYKLNAEVSFNGSVIQTIIKGKRPNQLYIHLRMMPPSKPMTVTTIYDGIHQWIELKNSVATTVMKVQLAKLTSPERPFDSSYNIMGTGLMNGEGYPESITIFLNTFDLQAQCSDDEIILSGPINIDSFKKYAAKIKLTSNRPLNVDKFAKLFGFITMKFRSKDYTIQSYSFRSDNKTIKFDVKFSNTELNKGIDKKSFQYQIPQGVVATDITNDLLSKN